MSDVLEISSSQINFYCFFMGFIAGIVGMLFSYLIISLGEYIDEKRKALRK